MGNIKKEIWFAVPGPDDNVSYEKTEAGLIITIKKGAPCFEACNNIDTSLDRKLWPMFRGPVFVGLREAMDEYWDKNK